MRFQIGGDRAITGTLPVVGAVIIIVFGPMAYSGRCIASETCPAKPDGRSRVDRDSPPGALHAEAREIEPVHRHRGAMAYFLSSLKEIGCAVDAGKGRIETGDVRGTIGRLKEKRDRDNDGKITVDDLHEGYDSCNDTLLSLSEFQRERFGISCTYYYSNLLQELALRADGAGGPVTVPLDRIFEAPVERISRSIEEIYWAGLTRAVDERGLEEILEDTKIGDGEYRYLYVPAGDSAALDYFAGVAGENAALKLKVVTIPDHVAPREAAEIMDDRHGILSLKLVKDENNEYRGAPFVVPGGRFNEMYGWDSYFIVLGLIVDDWDIGRGGPQAENEYNERVELAKSMVDNHVYEIRRYGKILNANRTYFLTRSQPPFLTSMALAVHEAMETKDIPWLKDAVRAAVHEYHAVWHDEHHGTGCGLSRYYGTGVGRPPEVEEGHFDDDYGPLAGKLGMCVDTFETRYIKRMPLCESSTGNNEIYALLDTFHTHDRAMRESGHDRTYRWFEGNDPGIPSVEQDRCAHFVTVDLNCLLYKYEIDIAYAIDSIFGGALDGVPVEHGGSSYWRQRARERKNDILEYLWNELDSLFYDFNFISGGGDPDENGRLYRTPATLYPLWACGEGRGATRIVDANIDSALVRNALEALEAPGGVAASDSISVVSAAGTAGPGRRQWDWPYGWAPHQMIAWRGLLNHGFEREAVRLVYRWLYTITSNAVRYNGTIPEKYDVVDRTHKVFAEYGNQGTEFEHITREGFGWMNASYLVGLEILESSGYGKELELKEHLNNLSPPEWIF